MSFLPGDEPGDGLWSLAQRLAGGPIQSLTPCRVGGNNRVYRAEGAAGVFALKLYPTLADDPRDRLGHEFGGLTFLAERVRSGLVPRAIAADREQGAALYEWIPGAPVVEHGRSDIAAVLDLLADLCEAEAAATSVGPAMEPCLAPADIVKRLETRLDALTAACATEPSVTRILDDVRALLRPLTAALGARATEALPVDALTLSPSDFGFHNSLRRPDGRLTFLDFEYFGWDDPAKAASDFLWHAGQKLSPTQRVDFARGVSALYGRKVGFVERWEMVYPLHGLNWVLIVLNEFRPERWRRRVLAGQRADWDAVKAQQLAKAKNLLSRVRLAYDLLGKERNAMTLHERIACTGDGT